jgi:vWA-MoxR associated protein C-terminal domain/vWA-MoxR associated protein middle region 0/Effector-associated domain 2
VVSAGRPQLPEPVRDRMVALLLEIDELHGQEGRSVLHAELRNRLGPGFEVPLQSNDRLYTIALLEQCQHHYGGLRKLVAALRLIALGHFAVQEIADLVAVHVPLELLTPGERADLRKLLGGLPTDLDVNSLYRTALGPLAPHAVSPQGDVLGLVDELVNIMNAPGQLPPLMVYVEHLAAATEGSGQTSAALRRWNDDVARRCELPDQLIKAARENARIQPDKPATTFALLVQVDEDGIDHSRFQLSVWLWQESTASRALARDDRTYSVEEIPEVIDRALLECGKLLVADRVELMVELILPHHLLITPVDQWLITSGTPFRRHIGVDYPVVVRSLDRMRATSLPVRNQWHAKWRWLQEQSSRHPDTAIRWMVVADGRDAERLYRELTGDQPVCVTWEGPPPPEHQRMDSVLGAAIWAGTPVALWCREHHSEGAHVQLNELLAAGALHRLPEYTQVARAQADDLDDSADHCGHHLSLLWDDPSRLPEPRLGLSAPSPTGGPPP